MEADVAYSTLNNTPTIGVTLAPWSNFHRRTIHFSPESLDVLGEVRADDVSKLDEVREMARAFHADYPARTAHIEKIRSLPVVYLRCGEVPTSGRSYNYRDGYAEAGVSVYRGHRSAKGGAIYLDCTDGCDPMVLLMGSGSQRDWYLVEGTEIEERGSDGEVLLTDVTGAKKLVRKPKVRVLFPAENEAFWGWAK